MANVFYSFTFIGLGQMVVLLPAPTPLQGADLLFFNTCMLMQF